MEKDAGMLICDWGSSSLRAYFVDADGKVVSRHESPRGIKAITGGETEYRETLNEILEQMKVSPDCPIRISGMAGSMKGWIETDYVATPAGASEIAANYVSLSGYSDARLFGGLKHECEDGSRDIMRGEEIQILGVLKSHPDAKQICLPGTHSKWATVENGCITGFKTYMTGDLFHSLCENSIFAGQISSRDFHHEGFQMGCRLARQGSTLDDLFRLRTGFVFGDISEDAFRSYLSGFLIGNELRAADAKGSVHLCGSSSLITSYALALEELEVTSSTIDSESATISGHLQLSQS